MFRRKRKATNFYLIAAIAVVAIAFANYFLVYIPNKTENLIGQGVRIMERMTKNINENESHFKLSIQNLDNNEVLDLCSSDLVYYLPQINEILDDEFLSDTTRIESSGEGIDSTYTASEIEEKYWKVEDLLLDLYDEDCFYTLNPSIYQAYESILIEAYDLAIEEDYENYSLFPIKADKKLRELNFYNLLVRTFSNSSAVRDNRIINIDRKDLSKFLIKDSLVTAGEKLEKNNLRSRPTESAQNRNSDTWEDKSYVEYFGVSADDLLSGVKRHEFFDDIFLVNPKTNLVIDQSKLNVGYFNSNSIARGKNTSGDSVLIGPDSLPTFSGVNIGLKEISNSTYYVYNNVVEIQGTKYILTGLKSKSAFRSQVMRVSVWVVMIAVIMLIILVQILPVIKPFLISKKESLKGSDLIWASAATLFGVSAISLFALSIDTFEIEEIHLVDKKLESYTDNLNKDFKLELQTALKTLNKFHGNSISMFGIAGNEAESDVDSLLHDKRSRILLLNINEDGHTQDYLTIDANKDIGVQAPVNLSHRNYFKAHFSNGYKKWKAPESSLDTNLFPSDEFFLESIMSMSDGRYQTTISAMDSSGQVLALVMPFKSLNNVFLEPDYTFCVVDKNGDIQYHSDQNRINNENFFEECNFDEDVQAFVKNGARSSLSLNFAMKDYRAYFDRLQGTDWSLITFYDVPKSRQVITSSLSVVLQLIVATIIYLVLLHFLLRITSKGTVFARSSFIYSFLNPLQVAHHKYKHLLKVNGIVILLFIVVYKFTDFNLLYLLITFYATLTATILYTFVYMYYGHGRKRNRYTSISNTKWFEWILYTLTVIWIILFGFTLIEFERPEFAFLAIVPSIVLLILSFRNKKRLLKVNSINFDSSEFSFKPFYFHALSWVMIMAIIPTLMFFKPVYNYQHAWRKADNLIEQSNRELKRDYWGNPRAIDQFSPRDSNSELTNIWFKSAMSSNSERFIEELSFYFNNEASELNGLTQGDLSLSTVKKKLIQKGTNMFSSSTSDPFFELTLVHKSDYSNENDNKATFVAFSLPRIYYSEQKAHAWSFWIVVLLSFVILYFSIQRLTEKFFYLDLSRVLRSISLQQEAVEEIEELKHAKAREILLVGIPFSGRNALASALSKVTGVRTEVFDFMEGRELIEKKLESADLTAPVIINNLDYSTNDIPYSRFKLELIEKIQAFRSRVKVTTKFILISGKDAYQLLYVYDDKIQWLKRSKDNEMEQRITEKRILIDRWESALYAFRKHIIPISNQNNTDIIESELGDNQMLTQYRDRLVTLNQALKTDAPYLSVEEKDQKVVTALLDYAENYYFAIWNSCSREEKFLLHDLANDGIVNSLNEKAIYSLVRKGILVVDPKIEIFNLSFKLFILESVGDEEIQSIEKEARQQGNWKSYQYLVVFLVVVVVVFLSLAEETAVTQITGLLSLGALVFPKMVQILGAFTRGKSA